MKLNWGHKLTLGILLFMGFIFFLVYKAVNTNYDLVSKEYYKDELQYQDVIDGTNRANKLSSLLLIKKDSGKIIMQFPAEMKGKKTEGKTWFYCPTDAKKDRKYTLDLTNEASQILSSKEFSSAKYIVKTWWTTDSISYYNEQPLTIK
jgi:hypothetical protein